MADLGPADAYLSGFCRVSYEGFLYTLQVLSWTGAYILVRVLCLGFYADQLSKRVVRCGYSIREIKITVGIRASKVEYSYTIRSAFS